MVVSVVDGIEKFSRLWKEGSDLAIIPSRKNALSISHELHGVAFKTWNLNSEEFLSRLCIPDTDVIG